MQFYIYLGNPQIPPTSLVSLPTCLTGAYLLPYLQIYTDRFTKASFTMADVFGTTATAIELTEKVISLIRRYKNAPEAFKAYEEQCQTTLSRLKLFKTLLTERKQLLSQASSGDKIQDGCNETVKRVEETLREFNQKLESLLTERKASTEAADENANGSSEIAQTTGTMSLGILGRGKMVWFEKDLDEFAEKLIQGSNELHQWIGLLHEVHLDHVDGALERIDGGIRKMDVGLDRLLLNFHLSPTDKSQSAALLEAVRLKDANKVEEILIRGIRADARLDDDDNTALHIAASSGLCDVIDVLLAHKAQVLVYNKSGETPLELALLSRREHAAEDILSKHPEAADRLNRHLHNTPLHLAAKMGILSVVQTLLIYRVKPDCQDDWGWTPLHLAVAAKPMNLELVEQLVQSYSAAGLAATTRASHTTVLHMLARMEESDTVLKALKLVADAADGADGRVLNARMKCGRTPLYQAALDDHTKAATILLDHGAKIDMMCEPEAAGPTALWASWYIKGNSAGSRSLNTAELLLKRGADTSITLTTGGTTLLHYAIESHSTRRMFLLFQYDTKLLNIKSKTDETPLHLAVRTNIISHVEILLNCRAQVDGAGADQTPFMYAASQGQLRMMMLLRKYGAKWDHRTRIEGVDAFILAVINNHSTSAGYLLGVGRHLDALTPEGYTALHFAARDGHLQAVRWLVDLGADVSIRANKLSGNFKTAGTAAEVAREHGYDEVAEVLEKQLPGPHGEKAFNGEDGDGKSTCMAS